MHPEGGVFGISGGILKDVVIMDLFQRFAKDDLTSLGISGWSLAQ